jgi:hypothetical protein
MSVAVQIELGYGVDSSLTIDADIDIEATSLSGIYVRAQFASDTDRSTDRTRVVGTDVPVAVERWYTGEAGAAPQITFQATAGATAAPVAVKASSSAGGSASEQARTGDTVLLSLAL